MTIEKPKNKKIVGAALRLLARRDMSRHEFLQKLNQYEYPVDESEQVADWCIQEGFLNEQRFIEAQQRRLSQRYGARRVAATLKQKGITVDDTKIVVETLKETELERAREIWSRKFSPAIDPKEKAKQIRFLMYRGFGYDTIKKVMDNIDK